MSTLCVYIDANKITKWHRRKCRTMKESLDIYIDANTDIELRKGNGLLQAKYDLSLLGLRRVHLLGQFLYGSSHPLSQLCRLLLSLCWL